MARNVFRFVVGALALVAVGVGALFLADYVRYRRSPEYRAEKYFGDLEKRYREDTYGGTTPEETLQLFIDALKKGDIDLASKYFPVDVQEKWKRELQEMKNEDNFAKSLADAEKLSISRNDGSRAYFTVVGGRNVVEVLVILGKGSNGRWKILKL